VRILIVDDEPAARRRLALMLEELDEEVVGEAENGVVALELARERRPDLVLLDIRMPEVDGLDVARHLADPRPLIVFQTAYDEYALRAFEHAAIDYLVKPVSLEQLGRALGRARERLESGRGQELSAELLARLRSATPAGPRTPRLLVRQGQGHRLLPYADILRFLAEKGVVFAHTPAGRFLTDHTLIEIEERTAGGFVRANRSELVNIEHVVRITSAGDRSASLTLSDGSLVHVSRRRAAEVREALAG
jgi:two-component system, LytTR family, response regulator AlgR